jgi:hypothetical protein
MRRPDFQNFTNGESTNEEPPTDVGVKIFPLINGKILWGFPLIYPMISMYDIRFPSYSHSLESMQTGGGLRLMKIHALIHHSFAHLHEI